MKSIKKNTFLFLCIAFAGCTPQQEKIDGSVFIVTQGGENFKLGLVTVSLLDRQHVEAVLQTTTAGLQNKLTALKWDLKHLNDEKDALIERLNTATEKRDSLKQQYDAATMTAEATAKKFDPTYYYGQNRQPEKAALTDEEKQKIDDLDKRMSKEVQRKLIQLQNKIDTLKSEQKKSYNDSDKVISLAEEIAPLMYEQLNLTPSSSGVNLDDALNLLRRQQEIVDLQAKWNQFSPEFAKDSEKATLLQSEWSKSSDEVDAISGSISKNQTQADSDSEQIQNWSLTTPQAYFLTLPPPLAVSKTDADGKFNLQLPTKGDFALAAQAQRQLPDHTEKYFWLIRVHSDGQSTMQVMLSNDNLITANTADSAVRFPTP